MTGIQGGDPLSAFVSGAVSSIAAGMWSTGGAEGKWQGFGGAWAKNDFGTIAFGTFAGGAGAKLSGGNFWQGAVTGLMVSGLNHAMHRIMQPDQGKKAPWDTNGDGKLQKREADIWGYNHGGDITVDGNLIDLTGFKTSSLDFDETTTGDFVYSTTSVFDDLPAETADTYGGSTFRLVDGKWQMQSQLYHYNMRSWDSFENIGRNLATLIGYPVAPNVQMVNTPVGLTRVQTGPTMTFEPFFINIRY